MIVNSLSDIGFKEIRSFPNGKEAWDYISQFSGYNGDVTNCVAAVITDIEMPQMDGHHLTKLIKSDPTLKRYPFPVLLTHKRADVSEGTFSRCGRTVLKASDRYAYRAAYADTELIIFAYSLFAFLLPATVEYLISFYSLLKFVSFYLNFTGRSNILPSFFCSAALYA